MQVLVSPSGEHDPLPAEVRLLNHSNMDKRNKFYYMSPVFEEVRDETSPSFIGPPANLQVHALQHLFKGFLQECVVKCWGNMKYQPLPGSFLKGLQWTRPTEAMKVTFIDTIDAIKSHQNFQPIKDRLDVYGSDFIAELVVNLAETLRVHKNWNSQAANVGAAVCNMAVLLADCKLVQQASGLEHFRLKRPAAKVLTGGCYGSRHNLYMEYMSSGIVNAPDGTSFQYLTDETFRESDHERLVMKNFDRTDDAGYPVTRPTKACTPDWSVLYRGVEVLHGEGKSEAGTAGVGKACLCAAQQLAFNNTGLVLHSSANKFRIFKIKEVANAFKVTVKEIRPYNLSNLPQDLAQEGNRVPVFPGMPPYCQAHWQKLEAQQRNFLIAAFDTIDILAHEFTKIDFDAVQQKHDNAYSMDLFVEPSYWPSESNSQEPFQRDLKQQQMYVYSPSTMTVLSKMKAHTTKSRRHDMEILQLCMAELDGSTDDHTLALLKTFQEMFDKYRTDKDDHGASTSGT